MRKNWAAARLAVLSQLEYRINFAIDVIVQPILSTSIEVMLWMAMLTGMGVTTLGGFGRESYLAYALWATFVGRVTTNWMYEFMMMDDIDSGRINAILVRPIALYQFYLAQFMGYKASTIVFSFILPLLACWLFHAPLQVDRLPLMIALLLYYLIFAHTLSFCVACLAFFMSKVQSLTAMKNLAIWVMAGELIPLDLYPEPLRTWLIHSPFASGVYVPVGYVIGRVDTVLVMQSFISLTCSIVVMSFVAYALWWKGLRAFTGTGA